MTIMHCRSRRPFAAVLLTTALLAAALAPAFCPLAQQAAADDVPPAAKETPAGEVAALRLRLRSRQETAPGSGRYRAIEQTVGWEPRQTAILVCDMWDQHWCQGASQRVAEMAPRMNEVLKAAREQGVLIIHCPSQCMEFYQDSPQRKLAQQAPAVETKIPLERWRRINPEREGELPIDDSDGGCDCQPQCRTHYPWKRQIAALEIAPGDAVTDSAEAYYLMRQKGIRNAIVLGVHVNMCVLGRPFGIRQLVYQGMNVALMRDLTDAMYNSRKAPFVNHFTGNDLMVEHIERHWCPSLTSCDFVGGEPFRFSEDRRKRLAIVMAEDEYETERTLPRFAREALGRDFQVTLIYGDEKNLSNIPGLDALDTADAALLSIRRRVIPSEQLGHVRKFLAAGKPLIAIRTTSHAFGLRNQAPPPGTEAWEGFDREILGCNYKGHYGNEALPQVWRDSAQADHPVLRGIVADKLPMASSLYKSAPVLPDVTVLMRGLSPDAAAEEPVAWVRERSDGGRVFYTSLGHKGDFQSGQFRRLLFNGIYWSLQLDPPAEQEFADDRHYAAPPATRHAEQPAAEQAPAP